jgi:hypothetical protein
MGTNPFNIVDNTLFKIADRQEWVLINHAWQGTQSNRLKMGFLGSSFYAFLAFALAYQLVTLKSSYPNENTCMGDYWFSIWYNSYNSCVCYLFHNHRLFVRIQLNKI